MFKLQPEREFEADVIVPFTERGQTREGKLRLRFRALDRLAYQDFMARAAEVPAGASNEAEAALLSEIVTGWPEGAVGDEKGNALPFGLDALAQLAAIPGLSGRIIRAYGEALMPPARERRRLGN